jgi:membrane protein YdbS with pleckstrin-like domain
MRPLEPEGREMPAIERFVGPDEEILWAARPHAAALARPLALASLAVLLGAAAVLASFGSDLTGAPIAALVAAAITAVAVVRAGRAVFRWDRTLMAVTPVQVVMLAGGVRLQAESVPLRSVSRLGVRQGPLQRILGYGTLLLGDGRSRRAVKFVPRPAEVSRLITRVRVAL